MAIEQAGLGQDHRTGVDAAKHHTVVIELAQPVLQRRAETAQRLEPGHHQQGCTFGQRLQRAIGVDRHAITGLHRPAFYAQHLPAVQAAAKAVGHP
ncbi:hypothetical protein D3C84_608870 [compost metagenome]